MFKRNRASHYTITTQDKRRLTGNALIARMQDFLKEQQHLRSSLKIASLEGERASLFMFRCMFLERFLDILDEEAISAHIKNEHNMIILFLHDCIEPDSIPAINQRDASGIEIDMHLRDRRAELKTTSNIDASGVPGFVDRWFDDMIETQGDKEAWWLVYFVQRGDANAQIGETCLYYMTAIEIRTRGIDDTDEDAIIAEVTSLIEKAEKHVKKEDGFPEGALLPVDNIVPMDRMRKKLKARDETIAKQAKALEDKEKALAEERKKRENLQKENAELKKRIGSR